MKKLVVSGVLMVVLALLLSSCGDPLVTGAKVNMQNKLWDKAIDNLNKAIEKNPKNGEAYFLLGQCYAQKKNYKKAGEAFRNALKSGYDKKKAKTELERSWVGAFNKGVSFVKKEEKEKAIEQFEIAKSIMPEKDKTYLNLAVLYLQINKPEKAKDNLKVLVKKGSNNETVYINLAVIYIKEKKFDEALEVISKGKTAIPESAKLCSLEATVYLQKDDKEAAIRSYEESLTKKDGDIPKTRFSLGELYFRTQKYEKALDEFKKVVDAKPDNMDALYNYALAAYKLEKYDIAKDAFIKLVDNDPNNPDYHNLLGACYSKTGEKQKAVEEFKKVEELNKGAE